MSDSNLENSFGEVIEDKDVLNYNSVSDFDNVSIDSKSNTDDFYVDGYKEADTGFIFGLVSIIAPFSVVLRLFFGSFFSAGPLAGLICGIVGLAKCSAAKSKGYLGKKQKDGFILSLIGTILNAVLLVVVFFVVIGVLYWLVEVQNEISFQI